MLFDFAYAIGGDWLVQLVDAIVGPVFDLVCNLGGAWDVLATALEMILG